MLIKWLEMSTQGQKVGHFTEMLRILMAWFIFGLMV